MLVVGVTLLTAACGSTSSPGSTVPATSSDTGGSEIVIGTIGTYSGPAASSVAPGLATLNAWNKDLNEKGGINGHKVRLVVKDDGGNATAALQAAKDLVSTEKVVAIVGDASLNDTTWADFISKSGVPVVGGSPQNVPFATNPDFFTVGTNYVAQSYGKLEQAKQAGSKVGSLFCAEAPVCAAISAVYNAFAPTLGLTVPVSQKVLATAPNFTGQCVALKDAGVQSYIADVGTATALSVVDQCHNLGVTARPIGSAGVITSDWLSHPGAQGARDIELAFPFFDASTPASAAYQAMLKKHNLGDGGGASATYTYLAGKLFEKAVAAAGPGQVTNASVRRGLYALKGETLGGLTSPLTYTEGKPTLINCWFVVGIENKAFTTPQGLKPSCAADEAVNKVLVQTLN